MQPKSLTTAPEPTPMPLWFGFSQASTSRLKLATGKSISSFNPTHPSPSLAADGFFVGPQVSTNNLANHVAMDVGEAAVGTVMAEVSFSWSMPSRCKTVAWKS